LTSAHSRSQALSPASKEPVEKSRCFVGDTADLVGGLAIEFEVELGLGATVFPFGEGFELAPPRFCCASAVRRTLMLTRGVWRSTPATRRTASAEVTTPLAIRPGPPSFSLAKM
jgi:hypothetical protein